MIKGRNILVFGAVLALASCSASGPAFEEIEHRIPAIQSGKGRIYFFRDSSWMGNAVHPDIYLNEVVVGESNPGGFFFIDTDPGKCRANCTTEAENAVSFTLESQETKYVRTSIEMGVFVGRGVPELVNSQEGREGVMECAYIGDEKLLRPEQLE